MRHVVALLLTASTAMADPVRPADQIRLDNFDSAAGVGLMEALAGGSTADINALRGAMQGAAAQLDIAGDWSCRTIKAGGVVPLAAYPPFDCRIKADGDDRWTFEKLTGSQRLQGVIAVQDGVNIFTGVGYTGDAPAMTYDAFPESQQPVDPNQTVPVVGIVEQTGPDNARLMMPYPLLESTFDVLWLTREPG